MSSRRLASVFAALGVSGALVAGGVAVGGAANATTDPLHPVVTYSCSGTLTNVGQLSAFNVPITLDLTQLAPLALAPIQSGTTLTHLPIGGSADLTNFVAALPSSAQALLGNVDSVTGAVPSFPVALGSQSLPVAIPKTSMTPAQLAANTPLVFTADLTKATQVTVPAGTYPVSLPQSFQFAVGAVLAGAPLDLGALTCTDSNAAERTLSQVTVVGAAPKPAAKPVISASAPKTAKIGKSVAVKVVVKNAKTGKVTATLGRKHFTAPLKAGKASVVVKGIKKGVNKIVVSFPKAASKTVKVTGK